jgi:diguanylate cyclase (GGDEF)-like protein/PAS domain S-box-containing protein
MDRLRAARLIDQDPRCHAIQAEDGRQALDLLEVNHVAVVLTDLLMTEMDGLELVRVIRENHPQIPVILMTGHGSEEVAMEALRVGATDYIPKHRLAQDLHTILVRSLRTATVGDRRRRCFQSLVRRESQFELGNDPELLTPLLEFLQEEMTQLGRWDSAEQMRITIALDEALRNALYHGNLEMSSELRRENDRLYYELARRRAKLSPYQERQVSVCIAHDPDRSRFIIRDEGPGFDTSQACRRIEPEDLLRPSGRGLLLMKSFMDSVIFNSVGNEVTLIKLRNNFSPPSALTRAGDLVDGVETRPVCRRSSTAHGDFANRRSDGAASSVATGVQQHAPHRGRLAHAPQSLEIDLHKRMLDQLHDAVYFVDTTRRIRYWNEAAERLTGYQREEVIGRLCFDHVLDHTDQSGCGLCHRDCPLVRSMVEGRCVGERLNFRHKDGRRVLVEVRVMPVRNENGSIIGAVEVFHDATSSVMVESAYRQTRQEADRDPLTGLANRRCLDRMMAHHLEGLRKSGEPLSLIMADLDHFKQINDTLGHDVGDTALARFANVLQSQCRPAELVARFGGEEFVILVPGHPLETAVTIAERLRVNSAKASPEEFGSMQLAASFGVAEAIPGETATQLLRRVDAALYRAKARGRNRVEVEPLAPRSPDQSQEIDELVCRLPDEIEKPTDQGTNGNTL